MKQVNFVLSADEIQYFGAAVVRATEKCSSKVRDKIWNNIYIKNIVYDFFGRNSTPAARASSFTRFLDHTQRRTTIGRASMNEF